ncbi:MAG: DUF167 domain-containing protein [Treponema sp.]|jgi:uncharacterized protein (TIGR00251 family)|nr:DUF167 domain-containing protein [Treponema sp.]
MKENKGGPGDLARVDIKAVPGASRTELAGVKDGRLRVRIAAAPEDGKANGELIAFFAKLLGCAKRELILERGEKSRLKTLAFPSSYKVKFDELIKVPKQGPC